jgi:hypothetical protein
MVGGSAIKGAAGKRAKVMDYEYCRWNSLAGF